MLSCKREKASGWQSMEFRLFHCGFTEPLQRAGGLTVANHPQSHCNPMIKCNLLSAILFFSLRGRQNSFVLSRLITKCTEELLGVITYPFHFRAFSGWPELELPQLKAHVLRVGVSYVRHTQIRD